MTAEAGIKRVTTTLWGVPADEAHFPERMCGDPDHNHENCSGSQVLVPFLTYPTSCTGPLTGTLSVDSWQEPGNFVSKDATMPAISGCDQLEFEPTLEAQPTAGAADSPSGLKVDLKVPQHNEPCQVGPPVQCSLAVADLKDAVVTLPAGLTVDPSSADGLEACSEEQIGYLPGNRARKSGTRSSRPAPRTARRARSSARSKCTRRCWTIGSRAACIWPPRTPTRSNRCWRSTSPSTIR